MSFMSSRSNRGRRTMNEINMVPFIDVMLVLLIIFMVTAPMIAPSMIKLPTMGQADKRPDKVIQVLIQQDGQITVKSEGNSTTVSLADVTASVKNFEAQAKTTDSQAAVVITADKRVEYEKVINVMDSLQKAGVKRLGLSVQLQR